MAYKVHNGSREDTATRMTRCDAAAAAAAPVVRTERLHVTQNRAAPTINQSIPPSGRSTLSTPPSPLSLCPSRPTVHSPPSSKRFEPPPPLSNDRSPYSYLAFPARPPLPYLTLQNHPARFEPQRNSTSHRPPFQALLDHTHSPPPGPPRAREQQLVRPPPAPAAVKARGEVHFRVQCLSGGSSMPAVAPCGRPGSQLISSEGIACMMYLTLLIIDFLVLPHHRRHCFWKKKTRGGSLST